MYAQPSFPGGTSAHLIADSTPPARRGFRRFLPDSDGMTNWETAFLFLSGTLTASIGYKIASIQYLEYVYFLQLFVVANSFIRRGYRTTWFRPYLRIGFLYLVFALVAFAFAVASLRFDFYKQPDLQFLRYPVIITVSRLIELFANVSIMLFLADQFRRQPARARFLLLVYFWTGVASAVYSIVSFPLKALGFNNLGVYSVDQRVRGFYNEGGPYGVYLISVLLVAWFLQRMQWVPNRRLFPGAALLLVVLVLSGSKAAAFGIVVLLLLNGLFARSLTRRFAIIGSCLLVMVLFAQSSTIELGLRVYRQASESYEHLSLMHRNDPNYVNGRVAGIFIVPRMIAAHPITGIGWGNYTVLRNSPLYRGASAWSVPAFTEDPGLGMYGLAADIGLPLTAFLLVCLFYPYFLLRARRAPLYLANLALAQPVAHLAGAQLNSTFPWIITAAALGLVYALPAVTGTPQTQHPVS